MIDYIQKQLALATQYAEQRRWTAFRDALSRATDAARSQEIRDKIRLSEFEWKDDDFPLVPCEEKG